MAYRHPPVSLDKAAARFEEFTGHQPRSFYEDALDDTAVSGYRLGSMVGVAYEATRDGKTDQYFHRFAKRARPDLVAKDDGRKLYVVGGDYKVTDRGIEDMATPLFVVNPSRRKRRRTTTKRRSSYKANPMRRTRRRRSHHRRSHSRALTVYRANPVRRRRRRAVHRYRANPIRGRRRRHYSLRHYRRNPSGGGKGFFRVTSLLMPAITVGIAAVGVEVAMGYLPLPANLKTGPAGLATKAALAVGGGLLVAKMWSRRWGEAIALGGLTIVAHDFLKQLIVARMPGVPFGGYSTLGYPGVGQLADMGEYVDAGAMGEYVDYAE